MTWIYLSPHLDDVALSLGGLIWEQTQAGDQAGVWTICAGDPPPGPLSPFVQSLHARWEVGPEAMETRRAEDSVSCSRLGAELYHFDIPDCIYRRSPKTGSHLYDSEESLWVQVHPDERELIAEIAQKLRELLPENARLVSPLALGDHVDHRLTRSAAELLERPLYFYADYPYVLDSEISSRVIDLKSTLSTISPAAISAWQMAVAAHRSQISTFWPSQAEMRAAIQFYYNWMGGVRIWEKS